LDKRPTFLKNCFGGKTAERERRRKKLLSRPYKACLRGPW
jgi:hypothetical protein